MPSAPNNPMISPALASAKADRRATRVDPLVALRTI